MERKMKFDILKYELFEYLLPKLLYTGLKEEQLAIIEELEDSAENIVQQMYCKLCEEEGIPYPFDEDAFQIHRYEQGGIRYIEIEIPKSDPQISYALRAYILYTHERETGAKTHWRYFLIKKFGDKGHSHILHINPDEEIQLGDEVTDHINDKEYERRCMARSYLAVLVNHYKDFYKMHLQ